MIVQYLFEFLVVSIILWLVYLIGRIDGFRKPRNSYIDIQISKSIRHFQNFVFRNSSRFYEIIKNFIRK
ncbi:hypothetical protein DWB91_07885 [Staphylococcus agnetis]|nr:hypothetical protein DWB91_07885 [Staphylococcus agnetis]